MYTPSLIHEYLACAAEKDPGKTALVHEDERWTFGELEQASSRLATVLVDLGVKRHDRVAILLDNTPEAVAALYGTLKAGAAFMILDSGVRPQKLRYLLEDSGSRVLIADPVKGRTVEEAIADRLSDYRLLRVCGACTPAEAGSGAAAWTDVFDSPVWKRPFAAPGVAERCIDQDLAAIVYTSGSTGSPKGVICPHQNMIAVAQSIIRYLENTPSDILLDVLPLSFGYGLYQVLTAVMFGGTVVLERSFAYPVRTLERAVRERVTGFALVPTIAALMLRIRNIRDYDFSSLRYITNAAAALPVVHINRLRELVPGVRVFSMYGLTECVRAAYLSPAELDRRPDSVGKAIPNCETIVVDEQGNAAGPGVVGELVVRGSNVMRGYWNAPELTSRTFRQGAHPGERILYTGDLFRRDEEGYLYFVGRKDDMIKCKGERVSPRELENVLCGLEGIAEAAAIGVPDEILGQAIKVFLVLAAGAQLTARDVLKHCSRNLEPVKMPKYVVFVDSLPKSPNGKVDKKQLKDACP